MELRDYIEMATKKAGSVEKLARELDQQSAALRGARLNKRGLPVYACVKIADLLGIEPMEVIAASELVTEKHEDRIAIFRPFVQAARHAQHLTIAIFAGMTAVSLAFENSFLIVRDFLL